MEGRTPVSKFLLAESRSHSYLRKTHATSVAGVVSHGKSAMVHVRAAPFHLIGTYAQQQ